MGHQVAREMGREMGSGKGNDVGNHAARDRQGGLVVGPPSLAGKPVDHLVDAGLSHDREDSRANAITALFLELDEGGTSRCLVRRAGDGPDRSLDL